MMAFIEERWAGVVLSSFAGSTQGFTVREGEVDWLGGTRRFMGAASEKANLGLRVALAFAMWAPFWTSLRFSSLAGLSGEERSATMERLLAHPIFFIRELTLLLKLVACMAIFRSPEARARTDYDRPVAESTGTRKKSLPLLSGPPEKKLAVVPAAVSEVA
jgi:hypothetical protein